MVTVVKTPQGHKIIDDAIEASIIAAAEEALVVFPYHGLTTGDHVYITSDIDEYNGFWYVDVIDYESFRLKEHSLSDTVEYYQDADIDYYHTESHDWNSIYLPIVYKVKNDRWPLNTSEVARSITSQADDNGFTTLNLSGVIRSLPVRMLEFIEITEASDDDLNSVWQIVEVISTTSVTINMPYSISNSFTGAFAQYYYNNYQVRVKIWAGLGPAHPWTSKKPYEQMAELSLTPDENNEVMFSVSDYIKSKVAVKNNLTLFSLPLNLDAFTGFYIETAESYDYSDNYSLLTSTTTFETDEFEYFAVAGKLPFKNTYSGEYADYIMTNSSPARWLTNAARLLAVEGYYFDVSFIKNIVGPLRITIYKYASDYVIDTEVLNYEDQGVGVYRIPITPDIEFDSFCVLASTGSHTEIVEIDPPLEDLSTMTNQAAGGDLPDWTLGAEPFILAQSQSDNLTLAKVITSGAPFQVNYKFLIANKAPGFGQVDFESLTSILGSVEQVSLDVNSEGIYDGSFIFPATGNADNFTVTFQNGFVWDMHLLELSFGEPTTEEVVISGQTLTEQICIDILETCEAGDENLRLLEDGGFRLLEDEEFRELE